jgi:tRNA(Leu) C34 or U34 (ribose-2'-O)-methylase TrmL
MRLNVVLFRPSIAGNIGAVFRTATGFSADLHIIGPTAVSLLDDRDFRRGAGSSRLKSTKALNDVEYDDFTALRQATSSERTAGRSDALPQIFFYSTVSDFLDRAFPTFTLCAAMTKFAASAPIWPCMQRSIVTSAKASSKENKGGHQKCGSFAVLLGNESLGLSHFPLGELLEYKAGMGLAPTLQCFSIPMAPPARSHNLAVAAGIALFELNRSLQAVTNELT